MGGIRELLVGEMIQVAQFVKPHTFFQAFKSKVVLVAKKNLSTNASDETDTGSIPGWGRSPGEETGYPLQYSCLENPMDREPSRLQSMDQKLSDAVEPTHMYTHILLIQEKAEDREVVTMQDRTK